MSQKVQSFSVAERRVSVPISETSVRAVYGAIPSIVAMWGEVRGVAVAGDDVAQDAEPGHAGDVTDDER